jgi:hypothetical protein
MYSSRFPSQTTCLFNPNPPHVRTDKKGGDLSPELFNGSECSGSIKGEKYFDKLQVVQLIKKGSFAWN